MAAIIYVDLSKVGGYAIQFVHRSVAMVIEWGVNFAMTGIPIMVMVDPVDVSPKLVIPE